MSDNSEAKIKTNLKNIIKALAPYFVGSNIDDTASSNNTTYSSSKIDTLFNALNNVSNKEIVEELPTENIDVNTMYLVPNNSEDENNYYDEYLYIESRNKFELVGNTRMNLSGYVTTESLNTSLATKVDKVSGKGLSTNDYTTEEKTKLASLKEIQKETMPLASSVNPGEIRQYTGLSNDTYKNGHFYQCVNIGITDSTPSKKITSFNNSNIFANSSYPARGPEYAFNNTYNSNDFWSSNVGVRTPVWIGLKNLNESYVFSKAVIYICQFNNSYDSSDWKIQGSNDGENWVDISETIRPTSRGNITYNTIDKVNTYNCFRLYCTTGVLNSASSGNGILIGEISFYTYDTDAQYEWIDVTDIPELSNLTGIEVSSPTDKQVLSYNATSQQWENMDPEGDEGVVLTQAEFNLLSQEEKDNGTTYYISDANVSGSGTSGINYSLEEQKVGTYIDGKKLYQKTWTGITLAIGTQWKATTISIPNGETVVSSETIRERDKSNLSGHHYAINSSGIVEQLCYSGISPEPGVCTVTLQYTKTTNT